MFDDLEITITPAEPTAGDNVTIRYNNTTETGTFSLAAVADHVAQLNAALNQVQPALEILKSAGSALFDTLLGGDLLRIYAQATAPGRRVRLRLNSKLPDLIAIPWEYLYDRDLERWLALQPDLSLVRTFPVPGRKPAPVEGVLRVLVMISDPSDLPPLDTAAEWANLESVADVAAIELIRVEPTYAALLGALRQQPHVFHFIGHGLFDTGTQQGLLYLQTADGSPDPLPAERLATVLTGCESLRLALLNACQGATPGNRSAFAGVAQRLIQQGLPAVIAMQTPILDTDALVFSQEFYRALADGYNLEAALGEGRKRIADRSTAWGVPALYCQGSEPFAIPVLSNEQKAARLWQKAQAAREPARRRVLLAQILALDAKHAGAATAVQQLQNAAEAEQFYRDALRLYQEQAWREAYRILEKVEQLAPNYSDTRSRLAELLGKLGAAASTGTTTTVGSDEAQRQRFQPILNALREGRLVPFLGWGLGRVGRPPQDGWAKGHYLPDADEIATFLTQKLGGDQSSGQSLLQISQATSLTDGPEALYERLHELYATDYPPTILHRLLAEVPARLAAKGYPQNKPDHRFVYFSAAFDTLLEQAFAQAGQPYHLFAYRHRFSDGSGRVQEGRFVHIPPGADKSSEPLELLSPNTYNAHDIDADGNPDRLPIIVKLCGLAATAEPDSVVVTEDQFLDYLPAQEIGALLPPTLLQQVRKRSFVFFGFSLYEWHFRLIWQRMKAQKASLHGRSWAILVNPSAIEQQFWRSQLIEPLIAAPEAVAATVNEWLNTL